MSSPAAFAFGGVDAGGGAMGKLFSFSEAQGWRRIKPSGSAPPDRGGQVALGRSMLPASCTLHNAACSLDSAPWALDPERGGAGFGVRGGDERAGGVRGGDPGRGCNG